jgi:hypothetical protein
LLSTGAGLGGLAGALAAAPFVNGRSRPGLIGGVVVSVASFVLLAVITEPLLAVIAVGLASCAMVQLDTLNMTELQRSTSADRLGRTLGLLHSLAAGWMMAGSIVMGAVAEVLGIAPAMVTCGVVIAVVGGIALVRPGRLAPSDLPLLATQPA